MRVFALKPSKSPLEDTLRRSSLSHPPPSLTLPLPLPSLSPLPHSSPPSLFPSLPPCLSSTLPLPPSFFPCLPACLPLSLPPSQPASLSPCLSPSFLVSLPSIYVSTLFMSLNNFLLAAFDDDRIVKFLFHKAASRFWKVGNGESHSCILDSDCHVDFACKPHKSYFKLPPEPITRFI